MALTMQAAAQTTSDLQQSLPSDWGDWQNLTYGVTDVTNYTSSSLPMQVETAGQAIHLVWWEQGKDAEGLYRLYYRRSADLGRSWEKAQLVGTSHEPLPNNGNNYPQWMAVSGSTVHIVWFDNNGYAGPNSVNYARSTNGGQSFDKRTLLTQGNGFSYSHIAATGQTVVVAFQEYHGGSPDDVHVMTSSNDGASFNDKVVANSDLQEIVDLKVQQGRWALMGYKNQYNGENHIYVTTSTNDVEHFTTKEMMGASNVSLWTPFNYSHMAMDGQNIYVVYRGVIKEGDQERTIVQRSTDGGATWQNPVALEGTCGIEPNAIAAKGDHVYVLTTTGTGADSYQGRDARPTLFYSHDGGKTFTAQRRGFDCYQPNIPSIAIDPKDPLHVVFSGQRAFYLSTNDGFRTISRNFFIGSQSDVYRSWNNNALQVFFDSEGTEHWVMQYSPAAANLADWDAYYWNIVHRRVERPAASGNKNMAYDATMSEGTPENKHLNNVIVPMTPSLEATAEATTVECWVRPDENGFQIASLTNEFESDGGGVFYGGWYLSIAKDWRGRIQFEGGINCEASVEGKGVAVSSGPYHYAPDAWGLWHHVALTYDSKLTKDNFRFYVDGALIGTATDAGKILMGNKAIFIGPHDFNRDTKALIDNFAVYSRALTAEEIREHLYNVPDAKDEDCRLLLTFDGTLRDQSQYANDPVPVIASPLKEHDGIRAPHAEFILTKDMTGKMLYATDMTQDGQGFWWLYPYKTSPDQMTESEQQHMTEDYSGYPGNYTYWMVARGDGKTTNACAATRQTFTVGGLKRVWPETIGNTPDAKLFIEGGYTLTYNEKPNVVLKNETAEITGMWDVPYGYDASKVTSADELIPATFNLWKIPTGVYDVIVGTDTLRQAVTIDQYEEPDVWMQINGGYKMLYNKYMRYTIDYGNRSNVPAYNTPVYIAIPNCKGKVDVKFEFDYTLYSDAFDDEQLKMAKQVGEYLMTYDEQLGDSIRIYSFFIPFIAPNSTNQQQFRIKISSEDSPENIDFRISYMICEPWGPWDDGATTRAVDEYDEYVKQVNKGRSKAECALTMLGMSFIETGLTVAPIVGCVYNVGKTITQKFWGKDKSWGNFGTNFLTAAFACGSDLFPPSFLVKAGFAFGKLIWDMVSNKAAYDACLRGDPNWKDNLLVYSYDPNEMIGPSGFDDSRHYIKPIHQMPYTITFENKSIATAPANEVFVTDTLDLTKFKAETFGFNSFGWADKSFIVGGNDTKEFTRDVIFTVNGHEMLVRVSGQFIPETGVARWSFISLEKNGKELDDIMNGFLLPNDKNGRGEGFVSFNIEHKDSPANGSTVSNKATIVFDANKPIVTNTYVNTFDRDYPTSKITKVEEKNGQLVVTLQGSDATSGIDHYTLYAFKNGSEEAEVLVSHVTNTQMMVACEPGTTYGLCAIATDRVGWSEPKDVKVEKTITTTGSTPTITYTLNVPAAGYATFYDSRNAYSLPAGLKASTVSAVSGDRLSYQTLSGSIVPKNTAVLIEATKKQAATYTLTSTVAGASAVGTNLLHGSDVATTTAATGNNLYYKLSYGASGSSQANSFGWYWGAQNGAPFKIEAHRAWLAIPKSSGARAYLIDGSTAIDEIQLNDLPLNTPVYDLQGRRVEKPTQPGIYLLNGKKIVVK